MTVKPPKFVWICMMPMILLLAACGGGDSPEQLTEAPPQNVINIPTPSNTLSPQEMHQERRALLNTQAQQALATGAAVDEGFEVTVTGAVSMRMPPGIVQWAETEMGNGQSQLYFLNIEDEWAITITLPANISRGTHTFASSTTEDGPVVLIESLELNPAQLLRPFNQNIDGSLYIGAITDEIISGSFEFATAQQGSSGENTITVYGTFENIPKS